MGQVWQYSGDLNIQYLDNRNFRIMDFLTCHEIQYSDIPLFRRHWTIGQLSIN